MGCSLMNVSREESPRFLHSRNLQLAVFPGFDTFTADVADERKKTYVTFQKHLDIYLFVRRIVGRDSIKGGRLPRRLSVSFSVGRLFITRGSVPGLDSRVRLIFGDGVSF